MDYFDILLAKKLRGGGGGDITIKSLNVTQNGTYSEEGVAYSPVKVNVPLPENAYLLKDIPNTPTAIATFSDGSDLPMPKLEVGIEPVQEGSGDPSPTNIRQISGWDEVNVSVSGVNVWDEEWEVGTYSNVDGSKVNDSSRIRSKNFIPIKPNTQYFVKLWQGATYSLRIFYYDKTHNFISSPEFIQEGTITTPSNAYYMTFICAITYGTTYNNDISINYPSTDTSYHAYNGQTYTIDLNGTRYGGTLDVVSGVMTVTHGYLKLTDTDYNWQSGSWAGGYRYFTSNRITEALNNQTCQSSIYKKNAQLQEQGIAIDTAVNSNQIDVRTQHFSSLSSWKTYLASNPVDVRYELATPLTIQLPTTVVKSLGGVNNVWGDCGDILDLSYLAKEE